MIEFFKILADPTSSIPSYFSDPLSHKILYCNEPMKHLMGLIDDSYIGQKCYDIILGTQELCEDCPFHKGVLSHEKFYVHNFYCKNIDSFVTSHITLFTYAGKEIQFNKFYEADAHFNPIERLSFQSAMLKLTEILALPEKQAQIKKGLELLVEYYSSDRSYIYELDSRSDEVKNIYHFDGENPPPTPEMYTKAGHEEAFLKWVSTGTHLQVNEINFNKDKPKNLPEEAVKSYQESNYNTLTVCPLFSGNGKLKLIIGLLNSNRKNEGKELSLLKIMAQFVEITALSASKDGHEGNHYDSLTGAFNRGNYNTTLQKLKYEDPRDVGVVFINANGLKKTNQYYGLDAGDKLIKDSMELAKNHFNYPWFRLSGDEFLCFVTELSEEEFTRILTNLHNELSTMPQRLFALGSAWGKRTNEIDKLVETADNMMYIDKQTYYTDFDPNKMEFSDVVLQDLLMAVQEEEFLVYLQPQIELETGKVIGAEALIRRFNKKLDKMIFPDQFIPLYEKKSIIRHVDLFVLRKVCSLLQEWNKTGNKLKVSVNLSRVTLLEHGIVHKFAQICDDYNIDHKQIVVEVTERVGLIENDVESPLIEEFKNYGFAISLDDFGCAYSNIVTLATISVDEVKIDKSLVDHILTNHKNKSIVENMIRMVHSFGDTSTLAEGVETQEQADCLKECDCQYVQGYLYSRPIPNQEFFEKYVK